MITRIDPYGLAEWFRPPGADWATGSEGSCIPPGSWIGAFFDDVLPGGWQFATFHDGLIDDMTKYIPTLAPGNELWSPINIPTMPGCYAASISANLIESGFDLAVLGTSMAWAGVCWGYDAVGNVMSWGWDQAGNIAGFSAAVAEQVVNGCARWVVQELCE